MESDAPDTADSPALVVPSLRAFLHDIVDYAGYFPPADLSLAEAIRNYAEYRAEPEAWMLSRFVVPVALLPDLTPHQSLFKRGEPFMFSVLGTGGDTPDAFLDAFRTDLDRIETFHEQHRERARADAMEVPLPPPLVEAPMNDVLDFFEQVYRELVTTGTAALDLFLEVPAAGATVDILAPLCAAAAEHNSRQRMPNRSTVGLKIRCGGREPADVPPPSSVAAFIVACRDAGIRFKATAGLHHPVRHYDSHMETEMHGFLNVFGAAALAVEHDLDVDAVETVVREDAEAAFQFEKDILRWRDFTVSMETIDFTRTDLAVSFGSCSFDEPVDALRDMELI
jgi:hypothetical protein